MESTKQRDWLQVLGQFGVIASLIFVGLQMKQDQEIALSAAYQARTATLVEFLTAAASDDVVRSAMSKDFNGMTELTSDERFAATMMSRAGVALMQNSHYQYVQGYLDEEHWQSIRKLIKRQLQVPTFREILLSGNVRPSFRIVVNEIVRESSAETD